MPGLVPGVHALAAPKREDVDGRDRLGHDDDGFPIQIFKQLRRRNFAFSRRDFARALQERWPSKKAEGAGKTGCALHPRSRVQNHIKKRTRAYRFSGNTPAFPAQWFYGLLRALLGERPTCHRRPCEAFASQELDASTGASGPHDFAVRVGIARLAIPPRPPHPAPTLVTMADVPLTGTGWVLCSGDLGFGKTEIFFRKGLDKMTDLPIAAPSFRGATNGSRQCAPDDRLRREPRIYHRESGLWIPHGEEARLRAVSGRCFASPGEP
jgi:hypothetical protein